MGIAEVIEHGFYGVFVAVEREGVCGIISDGFRGECIGVGFDVGVKGFIFEFICGEQDGGDGSLIEREEGAGAVSGEGSPDAVLMIDHAHNGIDGCGIFLEFEDIAAGAQEGERGFVEVSVEHG